MNFYDLLKRYLLLGRNLNLLEKTQNIKNLEQQLNKFDLNNLKKDKNIINVFYQNEIFNLNLNEANFGLDSNHIIFNDVIDIVQNPDLVFYLKQKLTITKLSDNLYVLGEGLKKVNLTYSNLYTKTQIDFFGIGFKINYPLEINLIFKYDENSDFNFIENILENKDKIKTFDYVNFCQIKYKLVEKIDSSMLVDLSLNEGKDVLNFNSKNIQNEKNLEKESNFNVNDLFLMFEDKKKPKKKIKI